MEPGLISAHTDDYLVDFFPLEVCEAARCVGHITGEGFWQALKTIRTYKTPGINVIYGVYLWMSHMSGHLLLFVYNNWMNKRFTMGVVDLLQKSKHDRVGICNFRYLMMINSDYGEELVKPLEICPVKFNDS